MKINEDLIKNVINVDTSINNKSRVNVLHSKNLLNYTIPLTTNLGVTTSMSDGKLILDGTTTGAGSIYGNTTNTILLKAGIYSISATKISGTYQRNNKDTAIYISKTSDKTILFNLTSSNDYSGTRTIKLTEDTLIYLNIYINGSGMVLTNLVVGLQIERGGPATDFEIPVTPSINVDGEEIYSKPVVLYNNVDGSNEDITLNDNSDNYKYIDIYYKQQDGTCSFVRALPNTTVALSAPHVTDNGYAIGWSARNIKISGNKITTATTNRYLYINVVSTNDLSGASKTNYVYIIKVVGYK